MPSKSRKAKKVQKESTSLRPCVHSSARPCHWHISIVNRRCVILQSIALFYLHEAPLFLYCGNMRGITDQVPIFYDIFWFLLFFWQFIECYSSLILSPRFWLISARLNDCQSSIVYERHARISAVLSILRNVPARIRKRKEWARTAICADDQENWGNQIIIDVISCNLIDLASTPEKNAVYSGSHTMI